MANTTTTRKTAQSRTQKAVTNSIENDLTQNNTFDNAVVDEKITIIPREIDPNQIITVRNGLHGKLIYVSPRTKEKFKWDDFGDEQEMELRELRNAKSSAKTFFINNWFIFDEQNEWVIDYLGLKQYYKNSLKLDDFDKIFTMTPSEIEHVITNMPQGQKNSLAYRARQLIIDKEIDSIKVIDALERSLGVELTERQG